MCRVFIISKKQHQEYLEFPLEATCNEIEKKVNGCFILKRTHEQILEQFHWLENQYLQFL